MTDGPWDRRPTGRNRRKNRERRRATDLAKRRLRRRMAVDSLVDSAFSAGSASPMKRVTRDEAMRDAQLEAAFLERARDALTPQESHSVPGFGDVAYGAVLTVSGLRVSAMRSSAGPTVEAEVQTGLSLGLCVTRERLHHRFLHWTRLHRECRTGDDAFDTKFWVVGTDLDRVGALLDVPARRSFLELADAVDFEVDHDHATFEFEDTPAQWELCARAVQLALHLRARNTELSELDPADGDRVRPR